MKLFDIYSYNPFESINEQFIDDIIDYKEYENIYFDIEKVINDVNNDLEDTYFKDSYNYLSKRFKLLTAQRFVFNLFIKTLVLQKLKNKYKNEIIEIDVYEEELDFYEKGYTGLSPNRFSNHFAWLARYIGSPFTINTLGKKNIEYKHETSSKSLILKVINYDFSFLTYEFKKRIFGTNNKKKIFFINDNSILKEIAVELDKNKISLFNISNELKNIYYNKNYEQKVMDKTIYQNVFSIFENRLSTLQHKYNLEDLFLKAYCKILSEMSTHYIKHLHLIKNDLRKIVAKLKLKIDYDKCVSNGLFGGYGVAVADAMIENGIEIICAEHGLTVGNSKDSLKGFDYHEPNNSNHLFCYNKASKETFELNKNTQKCKKVIVGAPSITKKIRFKSIQKLLNKKKFKTSGTTIFYVSHSLEQNANKYFPYTKSNPRIFKDEVSLLNSFGKVNKNIVFKTYPTKQYLYNKDNYIDKVVAKYDNLKFIKSQEDFRYMRTISDIIVTQASESTLGWCIALDVPLVFLDSDYYEPLANESVKKAFTESFFVFNYDKDGWDEELINFLNKPYDEILKLWKEKEMYRKKYDDIYFLSSKKDAGKLGAKYILDLIDGKHKL